MTRWPLAQPARLPQVVKHFAVRRLDTWTVMASFIWAGWERQIWFLIGSLRVALSVISQCASTSCDSGAICPSVWAEKAMLSDSRWVLRYVMPKKRDTRYCRGQHAALGSKARTTTCVSFCDVAETCRSYHIIVLCLQCTNSSIYRLPWFLPK